MGSWGLGSDENDETGDIIDKLDVKDKKKLEKFFKKSRIAGHVFKHPGPIIWAAKHKVKLSNKVKKAACKKLSNELKLLKSGKKHPLLFDKKSIYKKRMNAITKELRMLKC